MSVITSSNRTPAEWREYAKIAHKRMSLAALMAESPHIGTPERTLEVIARNAIRPFDHVIAIDACGAPILAADAPCITENA